jgi:hypothetical protein
MRIGPDTNVCAFLLGLGTSVAWTLSRATATGCRGFVNALGGLGILALLFSVVSPADDLIQQELIRPATPTLILFVHTRVVPRRVSLSFSTATLAAGTRQLALRTAPLLVTDQSFERDSHFCASISIHAPPYSLPHQS